MTVIALDAMGGDFAPRAVVEGAALASRQPGLRLILVGDRATIASELARRKHNPEQIQIHHTPDVVGMEDAPTLVLRERPQASIRLCCELVARGQAQAALSAGNSGAFMVAAKHVLGTLPGIDRPAIAAALPLKRGATVLIDAGANVDCKPHYLVQFGQMGAVYARRVLGTEQPRVGLLNNGAEPGKGNELARAAFPLLEAAPFPFVGNVEARDLFRGKADVLVCDGYVGNLVLKSAEAVGAQVRLLTREALGRSPLAWLGYALVRGFLQELAKRTDYHAVGGSPLLGLNHVAIVCHGSSSARSILAAIGVARRAVEERLVEEIAQAFSGS